MCVTEPVSFHFSTRINRLTDTPACVSSFFMWRIWFSAKMICWQSFHHHVSNVILFTFRLSVSICWIGHRHDKSVWRAAFFFTLSLSLWKRGMIPLFSGYISSRLFRTLSQMEMLPVWKTTDVHAAAGQLGIVWPSSSGYLPFTACRWLALRLFLFHV